jgi:hypothetical protein
LKKSLAVMILFLSLIGCASYNRFIERLDDRVDYEFKRFPCVNPNGRCLDKIDDRIMFELRRYPCVDPQGLCVDKIEDWIFGL